MPPNTFTFLSEVFLLASYSGRPPATGRVARAGRGRPAAAWPAGRGSFLGPPTMRVLGGQREPFFLGHFGRGLKPMAEAKQAPNLWDNVESHLFDQITTDMRRNRPDQDADSTGRHPGRPTLTIQ